MTQTFDPFDAEAWPDAPGCDAFEHAIMLRSQAALAPQALPVLEAHLAACEACRDHAARTANVDAMLAPYGDVGATTWQSVHDRLRDDVRRYQRRTPRTIAISGAIAIAIGAAAYALFDPSHFRVGPLVATYVLFVAGMGLVYDRGNRRRQKLLQAHDVVGTYRGELERELRAARRGMWLWPISLALSVAGGMERWHRAIASQGHDRARLATGAAMIVLAVVAFARSVVKARRLRRELAGLQ